ncbi:MAG TPA: class I SAM-dependent methyltransferase [Candidatus Polarisedimenticolia bacterium]|nr:class I SAM-dependent methyltransferase [Candidatus Polarisedimenticolia bacterium]
MSGPAGRQGSRISPGRPCPLCGLRLVPKPPVGSSPTAAPGPRPVRCSACGLVFIDPIPPAALSTDSYGPAYYEPWQGKEEPARLALWRRRLRLLEERSPRGSLLDVGCGDGLFLKVARDSGWGVEGIEFSPEGARRASTRLGRPVAVGDLARGGMLRGPFDAVTLWHVLEHLPEPAAMLEAVRRRLRPGGLLVAAVPNLDNLPMRVAYRLARLRPLPLYEEGEREPHLSHFDPRTLSAALGRQGLREIEVLADRCALTPAKRAVDALAAFLSRRTGRLLTDAIVAFARVPR